MAKTDDAYIPALRFNWLTRFYDPLIGWTTREKTFKSRLVQQANLKPGHRVLDVGAGTGTLAILIKQQVPGAEVVALDGDPAILAIAAEKARRHGVAIECKQGLSFALPFADQSFDRCVSSLFFHHLTAANKEKTLREIFRILKPGGELHVADWGRPTNGLMRVLFFGIQLLDGFETTSDNVKGRLPSFMEKAGFQQVSVKDQIATPFGTMTLYYAAKP